MAAADAAAGSLDASIDAADSGPRGFVEPPLRLPLRSDDTGCRLTGTRADALPRVQPEAVLDALRFAQARGITAAPGDSGALFVLEQQGLVHRVDLTAAPATSRVVLDLGELVTCCEDGGLRGLAFHPGYAGNGFVFVYYVTGSTERSARLVRYTADPATAIVDPASAHTLLEVMLPGRGREGGALLFDQDGLLLVAIGDGGVDPVDTGARTPTSLLGAILRLDVDTIDTGGRYAIPADNPFAGAAAPTPKEVLAWGFRDPQHCSLDRTSAEVWCSDRGPNQSELNRIMPGVRYGWPVLEGNLCVATGKLCIDSRYQPPYASYAHFEGNCGIVGGELHGGGSSLLQGIVIYGDGCSGLLSGAAATGTQALKRGRIGALAGGGVRAIGADESGNVLVIDDAGRAFRLVLAPDGTPGTFPELLGETGCYADLGRHEPAAELIEFRVRSPLWSDGTHKRRFLRLPAGTRIEAPATGSWTLPVGSLLVKQFALQFDAADPGSVRPIETRFMLRRSEGWEFYSYRWNESATDAELVSKEASADFELVSAGATHVQRYQFPGPETCPICHAVAPGRVLGVRTEQLNHLLAYAGEPEPLNQLELLAGQGLLDRPQGQLPSLPDPADPALPIEQRARSYLHANCAHCHQPGGWSSPDLTMDLRYELPLAEANICGADPIAFRNGSALIAPGQPDQSAVLRRMLETDLDRMPPAATTVVDPLGEALLSSWITSLTQCP